MSVDYTPILGSLYGATLDGAKWQAFCDSFTQVTGGSIMVFGHRIDINQSMGLIGGGIDPAELVRYHEHFADKNPWMHMNVALPILNVGVSDAALSRQELFKTEFYNDWLSHQEDVVAGPAMICHRSADRMLAIAAPCRARDVDETLPRRISTLEFLGPHIQRVIQMALAFAGADCGSEGSFLDRMECGVVLIARSGRVAHINPTAERLIEASELLAITYRRTLVAKHAALVDFLQVAVDAIRSECFASLPTPVIVRTADGVERVIHANAFPSDDGARFPENVWADPIAGALVVTCGHGGERRYESLWSAFGLTRAEAKLAGAVVSGQSLDGFAETHGLSGHTVRNQMRALLRKTETRTQQDFVRKVLRLANPIGQPGS